MSMEKINIGGHENEPLGRVVGFGESKDPESPEGPEMPAEAPEMPEEPEVKEIVPDPPKEKAPPPPSKGILERIWKRKKKPGADKPN